MRVSRTRIFWSGWGEVPIKSLSFWSWRKHLDLAFGTSHSINLLQWFQWAALYATTKTSDCAVCCFYVFVSKILTIMGNFSKGRAGLDDCQSYACRVTEPWGCKVLLVFSRAANLNLSRCKASSLEKETSNGHGPVAYTFQKPRLLKKVLLPSLCTISLGSHWNFEPSKVQRYLVDEIQKDSSLLSPMLGLKSALLSLTAFNQRRRPTPVLVRQITLTTPQSCEAYFMNQSFRAFTSIAKCSPLQVRSSVIDLWLVTPQSMQTRVSKQTMQIPKEGLHWRLRRSRYFW